MPRKNRTPKHQYYIDTNNCRAKRRFVSERSAKESAELQELQHGQHFSVYKCERCSGWHLTRQKETI